MYSEVPSEPSDALAKAIPFAPRPSVVTPTACTGEPVVAGFAIRRILPLRTEPR